MYEITNTQTLAEGLFRMDIRAPRVARKAQPGQFLMLRATQDGERIPLTIASHNEEEGTVSVIVQAVGASTRQMERMQAGDLLCDVVGPLGNPTHFGDAKNVLCIGGGVGSAVLYPQVVHLHKNGIRVDLVQGARSKEYVILEEEFSQLTDGYFITTDDGSYGQKGRVTDVMEGLLTQNTYDLVIAIGPPVMMRAVCELTRPLALRTLVSLNPIMIDGTGMCGGCRVSVGGEVKYACVDGPEFDGHLVDFDQMMRRLRMYQKEEAHLCRLQEGEKA